jgi:hypothetical protein
MKKVLWVLGLVTLAAWIAIFLVSFRAALPQHAHYGDPSTNPRPVDGDGWQRASVPASRSDDTSEDGE